MSDELNEYTADRVEAGQLRQASVMRRFSVSLVFERQVGDKLYMQLYVDHVDAVSQEEALGKVLLNAQADGQPLADYNLSLRVVKAF